MVSSDTAKSMPFLDRFALQGKLISQLIAFWWRHYNPDPTTPQHKAARYIGQSLQPEFDRSSGGISNPSPLGDGQPPFLQQPSVQQVSLPQPSDSQLLRLFSADPAQYLDENPTMDLRDYSDEDFLDKDLGPILTLIIVFGVERIKNSQHYLSPIFDPTEIQEQSSEDEIKRTFYKFVPDREKKYGSLEDPRSSPSDNNDKYAFIYRIPLEGKPASEEINLPLEQWINDTKQFYPPQAYIPFTT